MSQLLSVREIADAYLELMERQLREVEVTKPHLHQQAFYEYTTSIRPAIRRIVHVFEGAGLNLTDEMEFEGPTLVQSVLAGLPPSIKWPNTSWPKISFFWPDGSSLAFEHGDALRAAAFFLFWQNFQVVTLGPDSKAGDRRVIIPGEVDHSNYMAAKAQDQAEGKE